MKLKSLTVENVSGLEDRTFSFGNAPGLAPCPVTLVTGAAGSGKTSLLRAIAAAKEAVGSYGVTPRVATLVRTPGRARLTATWWLSEIEQRMAGAQAEPRVLWEPGTGELPEVGAGLRRVFASFSSRGDRAKAELMPARRDLDASPDALLSPCFPDEQEGRTRLSESANKYGLVFRALHDATFEEATRMAAMLKERGILLRPDVPDALSSYKAAVAKMCPALRLAGVEIRDRLRPWVWFETRTGYRVELAQLSDSERQGVLFALAFARLGLNGSLLLIDTPELHIHREDQARFFHALCGLGQENQIIAATTSRILLDSVPSEQIIDLSRQERCAA